MELKQAPLHLEAELRIILDRIREAVPPPYSYVTIVTLLPHGEGLGRVVGVDKDRISVLGAIRLLEETLERLRQEVQ